MDEKEGLTPISIAILTILFTIVSAGVYITRGKSKFWLAKKIKIGALLLTISASVTPYSCVSCYDMPEPANRFSITDNYGYEIDIDLTVDNKITGTINDREGTNFSFNITDTLLTTKDTLQIENITATDGTFDDYEEKFTINIDKSIESGTYRLNFYEKTKNEQNNPREAFILNIKNED